MSAFREALNNRVLVLDGAMGTMLQERGLAPGACPETMNLQAPQIVAEVHQEYARAGADILVTNTFGGNRVKLAHYGLQERVYDVNARAVEIARSAAGNAFVALSIGPTGRFLEPWVMPASMRWWMFLPNRSRPPWPPALICSAMKPFWISANCARR